MSTARCRRRFGLAAAHPAGRRGCHFVRQGIGREYGADAAQAVHIIYGGSVAPEYADGLLASPEIDGLGASRKGRDPVAFAEIVRRIATAKRLSNS